MRRRSPVRSSRCRTPRTIWPRSRWRGSGAVNVGLIDDARPGDWVLIHVGFAMSQIDEAEALATRQLLEEMGAEYEQELEELKASVIE